MCDFTQLATSASEWLEYAATHPPSLPLLALEMDHEQGKSILNQTRVDLFTKVLGTIKGVLTETRTIPTSDGSSIQGRIYWPESCVGREILPLYIHFHGGGFYMGNLETEDANCRLICLETRSIVLNVNYRHTPQWVFPTPVQDAIDALDWIMELGSKVGFDKSSVIAGGISAGAAIASALAFYELKTGSRRLTGLVLTVPPTVHPDVYPRGLLKDGYSSLEQNSDAPVLTRRAIDFFGHLYQAAPQNHPYVSPLIQPDEDFRGFPPTCIQVAGMDPLRDEGLLFEKKLATAGVCTKLNVYPGFPHAFMYFPQLRESGKWRKDLYAAVEWLREATRMGGN